MDETSNRMAKLRLARQGWTGNNHQLFSTLACSRYSVQSMKLTTKNLHLQYPNRTASTIIDFTVRLSNGFIHQHRKSAICSQPGSRFLSRGSANFSMLTTTASLHLRIADHSATVTWMLSSWAAASTCTDRNGRSRGSSSSSIYSLMFTPYLNENDT